MADPRDMPVTAQHNVPDSNGRIAARRSAGAANGDARTFQTFRCVHVYYACSQTVTGVNRWNTQGYLHVAIKAASESSDRSDLLALLSSVIRDSILSRYFHTHSAIPDASFLC